jgi:hypothetical protein
VLDNESKKMLETITEWGTASVVAFAVLLVAQMDSEKWSKLGSSFSILWLFGYPTGMKFPPAEEEVKGKSFLEISDIGAKRMHMSNGGLGLPNSFLYWHWGMVSIYLAVFLTIFFLTTPLGEVFPWLTFVHKLVIFFNLWECLGLGVLHGPLHGKMGPPFTDWWYRFTPGTMKYNAPFMPFLPNKRNYLDVFVEGPLTYVLTFRCLTAAAVTPDLVFPLAMCSMYEFFFDYGQHLSDYGTQNLHFFVCMSFPVGEGQLIGIQLFLSWFYFSSGFCKLGPTFQHMFTMNLAAAKFMVDVPWAEAFRKLAYRGHDKGDYRLTSFAWYLATAAALVEMTVPLLTWTNNFWLVWLSIATMMGMHAFIISTLIIDVFAWNFTDALWYVILFGVVSTGVNWPELSTMNPMLIAYLISHFLYSASGHLFPLTMPYVVAHRHAAGNWSQGTLVIKKSAAAKLAKLKAHAGLPQQGPGWQGEWFAFHMAWSYFWGFNVQNKVLPGLVTEVMGKGAPSDGMFHSTGDYILLHSVLFFDALIANVRFDGISSLALIPELGRVCGFEEGECTLCWAGPFPTFMTPATATAEWKIVDSASGTIKEGTYTMAHIDQKSPSDCSAIVDLVRGASASKPKSS